MYTHIGSATEATGVLKSLTKVPKSIRGLELKEIAAYFKYDFYIYLTY